MIKIRLSRHGAKKNPFYRIVATEKTVSRGGKALEVLGYWYPKKKSLKIDEEKIKYWLSVGAKTTRKVKDLIDSKNLLS